MKKIISSLVAVAVLLFGEAQANADLNQSVVVTQKVLDQNKTIVSKIDQNNSKDQNVTKKTSGKTYTVGERVVQVVVTPIFIAGAIVAFIVVSPIWLLEKITGTGKPSTRK